MTYTDTGTLTHTHTVHTVQLVFQAATLLRTAQYVAAHSHNLTDTQWTALRAARRATQDALTALG